MSRNSKVGVRTQGNRIYDSQNGKTCHQCRQKTLDPAATCAGKGKCRLHWCFKCLSNRYGESVEQVSQLGVWKCPKCRGLCNCSNCQRRKGLVPTGCLSHSAKQLGYASVGHLLTINPKASRVTQQPLEPPATAVKEQSPYRIRESKIWHASNSTGLAACPEPHIADDAMLRTCSDPGYTSRSRDNNRNKSRSCSSSKVPTIRKASSYKKPQRQCKASELTATADDNLLPAPSTLMPEARQLGLSSPDRTWQPLPSGCCAGDLAEVLEFLLGFAEPLHIRPLDSAAFAAQLLAEAAPESIGRAGRLRGHTGADSLVAKVTVALLNAVALEYEEPPITSSSSSWASAMATYLMPPYCRQGQQSISPGRPQADAGCYNASNGIASASPQGQHHLHRLTSATTGVPSTEASFWEQAPAVRLRAMVNLCRDAMSSHTIRNYMEQQQEAAAARMKQARLEAAVTRKQLQAAFQEARNKELSLLMLQCSAGFTQQQQRDMIQIASEKARASCALAAAASGTGSAAIPALRVHPLGSLPAGTRFWDLSSSAIVTGGQRHLLVEHPVGAGRCNWGMQPCSRTVAAALATMAGGDNKLLKGIQAASFPARTLLELPPALRIVSMQ